MWIASGVISHAFLVSCVSTIDVVPHGALNSSSIGIPKAELFTDFQFSNANNAH